MRNPTDMDLRRLMVQMQIGQSETVAVDGVEPGELRTRVLRVARLKAKPIKVTDTEDGVLVERVSAWPELTIYESIDRLQVGESYLFRLPAAAHQRIRVAASARSRTHQVALTCTREGDYLRVTRLPISETEAAACGPIAIPARASKWPMDGLARGERLTFTVAPAEHHKVRLAASRAGKLNDWVVRCRLQDDGTMLVYRTDYQPQASSAATVDAKQ